MFFLKNRLKFRPIREYFLTQITVLLEISLLQACLLLPILGTYRLLGGRLGRLGNTWLLDSLALSLGEMHIATHCFYQNLTDMLLAPEVSV